MASKNIAIIVGVIVVIGFGILVVSMSSDSAPDSAINDSLTEEPTPSNTLEISDSVTVSSNATTPKNYDIVASDAPIVEEN